MSIKNVTSLIFAHAFNIHAIIYDYDNLLTCVINSPNKEFVLFEANCLQLKYLSDTGILDNDRKCSFTLGESHQSFESKSRVSALLSFVILNRFF